MYAIVFAWLYMHVGCGWLWAYLYTWECRARTERTHMHMEPCSRKRSEFAAPPPPPLLTPVCRRLGFSIGVYPGLESDGSYLRSVGVLSGGCVSLLGPSVSEEYAYMTVVTPQTSQ